MGSRQWHWVAEAYGCKVVEKLTKPHHFLCQIYALTSFVAIVHDKQSQFVFGYPGEDDEMLKPFYK